MRKSPPPRSISKNNTKASQIRNLVQIINELRINNEKLKTENLSFDKYFKTMSDFRNPVNIIDLKAYGKTVPSLLRF